VKEKGPVKSPNEIFCVAQERNVGMIDPFPLTTMLSGSICSFPTSIYPFPGLMLTRERTGRVCLNNMPVFNVIDSGNTSTTFSKLTVGLMP
jgi:hypothetical protein